MSKYGKKWNSTWWKNQGFLLISISTIPPGKGGGQLSLIAEHQGWSLAPPEFTAIAEGASPRAVFQPQTDLHDTLPLHTQAKKGQTHL